MENQIEARLQDAFHSQTTVLREPPRGIKSHLDAVRNALMDNPIPSVSCAQILTKTDTESSWTALHEFVTVGANERSDLCLKSEYVSDKHCYLIKQEDEWIIKDWDSKNGVYVNGHKVTQEFLKDGDIIQIADFTLIFFADPLDVS